ncbi:MAG: hypothetical protein AB1813_07175 [Verrucomicrobiota bacterium]
MAEAEENWVSIARNGQEFCQVTEQEILELLAAGFLLPTDTMRASPDAAWEALGDGKLKPQEHAPATASTWLKVPEIPSRLIAGAIESASSTLRQGLKKVSAASSDRLALASQQFLETQLPQIRRAIWRKVQPTQVGAFLADNVLMQKTFGAVYDCLPKPVYRFISEEAFIAFCMQHKKRLLDISPPESAA